MKLRVLIFLAAVLPLRAVVVSHALWISQTVPPDSYPQGADTQVGSRYVACSGWGQFLDLQPDGRLVFVTGTLGDPFAWFSIAQGEGVDAALVLGNAFWITPGPHTIFYGSPFAPEPDGTWLFAWWRMDIFSPGPGPNDCYGWLRLGVTEGKLTIVDDAANIGGPGIYAGTRIAVPEPTAAGLAGVLAVAALGRRRRGRV